MLAALWALLFAVIGPASGAEPEPPQVKLEVPDLLRAPVVLLEPKRQNNDRIAPLFRRGPVITGLAVGPSRIVISTLGLEAALPAELGDAAAPDRLAKKVVRGVRQQFWSVEGWDGVVREGQLVLVSDKSHLGLVELDTPLPLVLNQAPRTDIPEEGDLTILGVDRYSKKPQLLQFVAPVRPVDDRHAFVPGELPATFEGAVAFDDGNRWIGIVIGTSTPGAAMLLTPQAIEAALADAEEPDGRKVEVRWSAGFGVGTTFFQRLPLERSPLFSLRGQVWFQRRWDVGIESSWTNDGFRDRFDEPTNTSVATRRDLFTNVGTIQYLVGPRASRFRFGAGVGAGALVEWRRDTITVFQLKPGCDTTMSCPISADATVDQQLLPRFLGVVALDLLNFGDGPWNSVAGVRAGYRLHLVIPDVQQSTHTLVIYLQI